MSNTANSKMSMHNNEDVEVVYSPPSTTREFPINLEHMLVLRDTMKAYKRCGGRITASDVSPETDGDGLNSGRMYTMCIYPPIVGHAVSVNGVLSVCEAAYGEEQPSDMMAAVRMTNLTSLKWVVSDTTGCITPVAVGRLNSSMMTRASLVYERVGPLTAYNNHAVCEAAGHTMNSSFWQNMYPILDDVECHYGLYGLMHDNTVISLGSAAGSDIEPNLEEREPKREQGGFLDMCFTPQSKSSGKVRALTIGASVRIMTKRTIDIACDILSVLRFGNGIGRRDWVVRCMGFCCTVAERDVRKLVDRWKTYCEPNMPTMHVFKDAKVANLSLATGVIIRPMRTVVESDKFVVQGPCVDSVSVHNSDTMEFANLSFPSREMEPEQYFNAAILTIPFAAWTADPRLNLGMQMLRQGMSLSRISGDATIVSHGEVEPLVKTPLTDLIMAKSKGAKLVSVPGVQLVTAFVNRSMNMEDACSVSKDLAESGIFAWSGYINYPLPSNPGPMKIGMKMIDKDWWKPGIDGTLAEVRMSKVGDSHAVVHVGSKKLEVGDKLGVSHGLKFTVGELIPLADMPRIVNETTGEVVVPNLLISTKNLTRGLGGTIREMAAITNLFPSIAAFRNWSGHKPTKTYTLEKQKEVEPKLPSGVLMANGKELRFKDQKVGMRTVKATYGIMRVLQLRHVASLKHHYASTDFRSVTVPRGRYRQGTPRLSEGELVSMMMQNMPSLQQARDQL
ncbi:uncharacterized protein LTR77_011263 [Saxophila tyrrhenica]|uniref:DNA-directed RNA polymerase n=1 Tax=Saxophila tyrrhenica TaxID=1690608 RepID=A0AAV9NTY4_9PEZI|nr:hypothetical protein LTR77_011263 [Saxophila tyrrhenica]